MVFRADGMLKMNPSVPSSSKLSPHDSTAGLVVRRLFVNVGA